ncbi:MAG TPA: type 1 glutamine amidotransferase [Anaerolineae bacterium]|nr:type 1 glutamine amidotransferase [Anaerolineae bacterium]
MRVLVFQHDSDDGPGYLGEALTRRGATLHIVRLDAGDGVPDPSGYDLLLILGGEMNVYQEAKYPWLVEENRAIQKALAENKPVLGACLGGQLLAKALGARVHLNAAPEIGLTPIALTEAGKRDPLFAGLSNGLETVEWHCDTFDIPAGAVALASSAGCANQAFRFGDRAYGFQFHPEITPAMLAEWIKVTPGDLVDGPAFLNEVEMKAEALRAQAERLIDNFLGRVSRDHELALL